MALLPIFGFAAVILALGARLIGSGLRDRGVELWLGLFFVAAGVSMPVRFALASGAEVVFDAARVNFACQALLHAGVCCFAAFVWRTFRPASALGRALFVAVVLLLSANLALFGATGAFARQGTPVHVLQSASLALVFGWAFVEASAYHARLRRRAALLLSDPVVTNRFWLWTLWSGGLTILPIVVSVVRLLAWLEPGASASGSALGTNPAWTLAAVRTTVILVLPVVAGALWLAFFPPQGYRDWIRSRHPA